MTTGPEIYEHALSSLGHGFPLWFPEPEEDRGEITVGDVGFIRAGGFYRLLNITRPVNDPISRNGVPDNLPPFQFRDLHWIKRPEYLLRGPICSKSVKVKSAHADANAGAGLVTAGGGFSLKVSDEQGAVLILKDKAIMKEVHKSNSLVKHIRSQYNNWHRYVTEQLDYDLQREELIFVSGWVKTSAWAVAAFHNHDAEASLDVTFGAGPLASASVGFEASENTSVTAHQREGPSNVSGANRAITDGVEPVPETALYNQTVFLHYYKMKNRIFWLSVMRAAAGPHELPPGDRGEEGGARVPSADIYAEVEIESMPAIQKPSDPIDFIFDYIFENSDAEVAIACYRDLVDLCNGGPFPDDIPGFLRSQKPRIELYEDGLGVLWSDSLAESDGLAVEQSVLQSTTDPSAYSALDIPMDVSLEDSHNDNEGYLQNEDDSLDSETDSLKMEEDTDGARIDARTQHTGAITCLACSPDGRLIASGSEDHFVLVWNIHDLSIRARLLHDTTVRSVVFSPDSTELVSGVEHGLGTIWNIEEGEERINLEGHSSVVESVTYSPNSKVIATASGDHTARLWDAATGQELFTLSHHTADVITVVISPDSKKAITGSADFSACVWDVGTGALLHVLLGHEGVIWSAAVSPDSRRAVTGSDDGTSRIWNIETGEELVTLGENTGPVWAVAFSPDDKRVLSASDDSAVEVCDSFTGEKLMSMDGQDATDECTPSFSADGSKIVASAGENILKVCDASTAACVARLEGHSGRVKHMRFTPKGDHVVASLEDGSVHVFRLSDFAYDAAHRTMGSASSADILIS